jgi:hypothetical protein
MTVFQEDILLEFLENTAEAFSVDELVAFIRLLDSSGKAKRLTEEVIAFINARNLAFHLEKNVFLSRRACFESARFVINPSRLEIMHGILIPGHRCIPFANQAVLPKDYVFHWQGQPIPETVIEGAPEEFYPYYTLFGEEYAPQHIAYENPENEAAFNDNPYEDPPEVSIKTLDMSAIFRSSGFVPGDVFVVKTLNWNDAVFELERVAAGSWSKRELYAWAEEAEAAFREVFSKHGACHSIEEQISYAYWYGGKRMRDVPAYALDDYLFNHTEQIEIVPYGIETRFWFAGKGIPDLEDLRANQGPPDRTPIEAILYEKGIPISEYVIQSYVRDALFQNETDINHIADCVVPSSIDIDSQPRKYIVSYIKEVYEEFSQQYSLFADRAMGPLRKQICKLHTAVIEHVSRINKTGIDKSWFPKHAFIIFAQIQSHAAEILEDLSSDEAPDAADLEAMNNSLESMLETYDEMKTLIEQSIEMFRRHTLSIVREDKTDFPLGKFLTLQASLGGTDIWRRFIIPASANLLDLHHAIQILFEWKDNYPFRFVLHETQENIYTVKPSAYQSVSIETLHSQGKMEFVYEYGEHWTITLLFIPNESVVLGSEQYCIAGAEAAPPETIEGPLQFRRYADSLKKDFGGDKKFASNALGQNFDVHRFNLDDTNKKLMDFYAAMKQISK